MPIITFDPKDGIQPIKKSEYPQTFNPIQTQAEFYNQTPTFVGVGDKFANDSRFDKGIGESDLDNVENYRGEQESGWAKVVAGLIKGTAIAAETFISPIGLVLGLGEAAVAAFDDTKTKAQAASKIYDNEWFNTTDKINQSLEKNLPNYYTQKERDASAFSKDNILTWNFLGDKILKNAGYTAGMFPMAGLASKAIYAGAKISMSGRVANELAQIEKLTAGYISEGIQASEASLKAINEVGSSIKLASNAAQIGATTLAAASEATTEALGAKQKTYKTITDNIKTKKLDKYLKDNNLTQDNLSQQDIDSVTQLTPDELNSADDYASSAGNLTMGVNMAILAGSDYVQMGRFLKGMKEEKSILKNINKDAIVQDGGQWVSKDAISIGDKLRPFKGLITESAEEGSQTTTSTTANDYYSKKYDAKGTDKTVSLLSSLGEGIYQTFNSKEGLESMLLGGITGIGFGTVSGEIRHDIRNSQERVANTQAAVDALNNTSVNTLLKSAIRGTTIMSNMDNAVENNDTKTYKDEKHDLLKNYVQSRLETGKEALINEELGNLKNLDDEEFKKRIGVEPTEELRKSVNEYVDKTISEVNRIKEVKQAVDSRFSEYSPDVREVAYDALTNIQDRSSRIDELMTTLSKAREKGSLLEYNGVSTLLDKVKEFGVETDTNKRKEIGVELNNLIDKNANAFIEAGIIDPSPRELIRDVISLNTDRTRYAEKYKQLITPEGVAKEQETIDNTKKEKEEEIKNTKLQETASKFVGGGQTIINNETSEIVGRLYKIGNEYRLYKEISANNKPVGEYEIVNPATEEFQSNFDVHPEDTTTTNTVENNTENTSVVEPTIVGEEQVTPNIITYENTDITAKKADIEKRREEELKKEFGRNVEVVSSGKHAVIARIPDLVKPTTDVEKGNTAAQQLIDKYNNINAKYDAEIKDLEKTKTTIPTVQPKNTEQINGMSDITTIPENAENVGDTSEIETDSKDLYPNSAKRSLFNWFRGLAGSHRPGDKLNKDASQRAYYRFTNKMKLTKGEFFGKLELGIKDNNKNEDVDNQRIEVYITNKNGEYVDENGKPTSKENGIHTTLITSETPNLTYEVNPVELEKASKQQIQRRTDIIERLKAGKEVTVEVVGKGLGIPRTITDQFGKEVSQRRVIDKKEAKNWNIQVSTLGGIMSHSGEAIKTKNGFTYAQDTETGNVYLLQPRKLKGEEINTIVQLFQSFLDRSKTTDKFVDSNGAGFIYEKSKSGKEVQVNNLDNTPLSVFDVIGNMTFWTGDNLNEQGRKALASAKENKDQVAIKAIYENKDYQINKNDKTRFHFIQSTVPGGEIRIGDKTLQLFVQNETGKFVPNLAVTQELTTFLQDRYVQVSSSLLKNKSGFIKVNSVNKEGDKYFAILDKKSEKEDGYKNFLLNDEVLSTNVIPKGTLEEGEEVPQFSNQYAIIDYGEENKGVNVIPETKEDKGINNVTLNNLPLNTVLQVTNSKGIVYHFEKTDKGFTPVEGSLPVAKPLSVAINKVLNGETLTLEGKEVNNMSDFPATLEVLKTKTTEINDDYEEPDVDELLKELNAKPVTRSRNKGVFRLKQDNFDGKIDIPKAQQFVKEAFGGKISFETLSKLINGNAWGMFKNSAIYIYENAEVGTEYHEAFHAVFNNFLENKEQIQLIKEYRKNTGDTKSTISQIEEKLAEDFRDYMLGNKAESLTKTKKSFFDRLINFIKEFIFGKPETIQNVFDKLKTNKYANQNFVNQNAKEYYSKAGDFGVTTTKNLLDGLNFHFFNELFRSKENVSSLFDKSDNSKLVETLYEKAKKEIILDYEDVAEKYEKSVDPIEKDLLKKQVLDLHKAIYGNWNELRKAHADYLKNYKLELIAKEGQNIVDGLNENAKTKDSTSLIPTESLKFSSKINSNKNIKLLIGSLPYVSRNEETGELDRQINNAGVPYNVDFGKTFSLLVNKLSNLTSWDDMKVKLQSLAEDVPYIETLLSRLGVNKSYDGLSSDDINQRIQFVQTFAKNENNFLIELVGANGNNTFINANQNTFEKRIKQRWTTNIKNVKHLQVDGVDFYKTDASGTLQYNTEAFNLLPEKLANNIEALKFLHILGINFSNLNKVIKEEGIWTKAQALKEQIRKGNQPIIFNNDEDANISGDLKYLMDLEASTGINNVENSLYNLEGELVYGSTLNSYLSMTINDIMNSNIKNRNDLYKKLPHLQGINSKVIDSLFDSEGDRNKKTIAFSNLDGLKETESDVSKSFSDIKIPDQLQSRFNLVLQGKYNLLRPADNSLERVLDFGTFFSDREISREEHLETFAGYLKDELLFAQNISNNGTQWNNLANNVNKGVILDIIKSVDVNLYNELIKYSKTTKSIDTLLSDVNFTTAIDVAISKYIDLQKEDVRRLLLENIVISQTNDGYINNGLTGIGEKLDDKYLDVLLSKYVVNSLVGNIEQLKILVGSPNLFKSVEDEFKRHSGVASTKKISVSDEDLNNWINDYLDKPATIKQQYATNGEPIIRTAVIDDVIVESKLLDSYVKILGKDAVGKGRYNDINEGDAQGYIHLDEYKRMLFRAGDWTFGKGSLEEKYQLEKGNKIYTDPQSGETFNISPDRVSKVVFNALKPNHFGPLAEKGFINSFYKLAIFPLSPSVIKGTELEKLNSQMELQNTGIVTFASGNKFGTKLNSEGKIQPLYKEGKFGYNKDNLLTTQDTYYKYWGIQVDMGSTTHTSVVSGTQMAKQIINGLSENGVVKPQFKEQVEKYLELNDKRIELGKESLIKKIGLTKTESGDYTINEGEFQILINTLKDEAISRDLPTNLIDGIDYIPLNGVDVLPNREKIENILFALADRMTISQKRFGGAKVQVASTMFEKLGIRETKTVDGKSFLTSNELKFYEPEFNEDGNIKSVKSMEVLLPNVFKGKVEIGKIDVRLLKLIGFRIPTQGLNSIESIVIKGFLPEVAGDVIVVPSELVTKVGSDFDIDKLNIYIPNFFTTHEGVPTYISSDMTYTQYLKDVTGNPIEENEFLRNQVENQMNNVMDDFILHPDNAKQLLTPNSAEELKQEAYYIKWLQSGKKGTLNEFIANEKLIEKNTPYNSIVETRYLLNASKRFLEGKSAVGITAIHSTFHILAQLYDLHVARTYTTIENKKEVVRPTQVNLLHNEHPEGITLGGLNAKDGSDIANGLSQWINAAVDAAKDPFMFDLNAGPQTLNTVLYLQMIGVPKRTISLFINQPIIRDYIANQEKYESMISESNDFKKFKNQLVEMTIAEYPGESIHNLYNSTNVLTNTQLENGIANNHLTDQRQVLADFIRYQETAKFLGDGIKGSSYDTNAAGKNISEMKYKLQLSDKVLQDGVIGNYDKVLNDKKGFISPYYKAVQEFAKMAEPLFKTTLGNKGFQVQFNKLLDIYFRNNINIPQDNVIKVLDKFKQDFIVYLVSKKENIGEQSLNKDIKRLFKGDSALTSRLMGMKEKYPNNLLLKELMPIFSLKENNISNIKIFTSKLDSIEHNQLVEAWNELIDGSPEEKQFGEDLLKFVILQSGLQNSPINFINLAPVKAYHSLVSNLLNSESVTNNNYGDFYNQFFLNNYNDDNIIPKRKTEGMPYYKTFKVKEKFKTGQKIYEDFPTIYTFEGNKVKFGDVRPIKNFRNNSSLSVYGIDGMSEVTESNNFNYENTASTREITPPADWKEEDNTCITPN